MSPLPFSEADVWSFFHWLRDLRREKPAWLYKRFCISGDSEVYEVHTGTERV